MFTCVYIYIFITCVLCVALLHLAGLFLKHSVETLSAFSVRFISIYRYREYGSIFFYEAKIP